MPGTVNVSHLSTDDWEHSFVTGNGRQGAACYGGPLALRVTLSHEGLFLPVDEPLEPPDTGAVLGRLRDLLSAGRYQHAADDVMDLAVAGDARYRDLRQSDPFVGAATLTFIPGLGAGENRDWRRSVDVATGVVCQAWGPYRQEVFVSRPHDVVVIRIRSPHGVSGRLHLGQIVGSPPVPIRFASSATAGRLALRAEFSRTRGELTGYAVRCDVRTAGAVAVELGGTSVSVAGADEVLLLARTTLGSDGPDRLDVTAGYDELLSAHTAVHGALFDRCRLELSGDEKPATTEELVATPGPALVRRLFDAGRYAVVSATGGLPPNLQGVWSGTYEPAWRGGYTFDGNLAAALAAAGPTGTPDFLLPLFDLLDRHRDDFRRNARRLYRCPGILVPPHLTGHGLHNHFTRRWCLTFWTGGAAWLARLYFDYWLFTGDGDFLRERALPFLREAASFYAGFAVERDGILAFAPSYSPENSPESSPESSPENSPESLRDGAATQASVNATMDVALLRDLLTNLLSASAAAGQPDPDTSTWQHMLARLPAYRVDDDGALAEWLWPGLRNNHAHRHASHLFGLWYEPDPVLLDDPALRRAAEEAVRRRLHWWREHGDEMAFGLVQLGLAAACLGLAEEAHEALTRLSTRYWRANLVSTHNAGSIFNTDSCGGLPALVTTMLVGSRGNLVRLLPALPAAWPAGSISGVLLRCGVRVERLAWSPEMVEVELVSRSGQDLAISVRGEVRPGVRAERGRRVRLSFDLANR